MKKWIWAFIILLVASLSYAIFVYVDANRPLKEGIEIATKIAKEEANLQEILSTSFYNGSHSYYVFIGTNDKNDELVVWVPEDKKKKVIVRKKKDGITKEEAIEQLYARKTPTKIISVKLGVENNIPLWEIYYRSNDDLINYYYIDFESGEWLKDIQNL